MTSRFPDDSKSRSALIPDVMFELPDPPSGQRVSSPPPTMIRSSTKVAEEGLVMVVAAQVALDPVG